MFAMYGRDTRYILAWFKSYNCVNLVSPVCFSLFSSSLSPLKVPLNLDAEDTAGWQKEEQEKIDTAEPLTEEQQQEKERLLQEVRKIMFFIIVMMLSWHNDNSLNLTH